MWLATSDHMTIPQVVFTDPQIASVGLIEESARSLKINIRTVDSDIGTLPGAQLHTDGYDGQAKIVVDEDRHVIVGTTFIGPQVGDLLNAATIAIVGQVPLERLWHAIPSFPTVNEVWTSLKNMDFDIRKYTFYSLICFSFACSHKKLSVPACLAKW
jgi:pyruvate/2-oxoglutarate dehydrogenase complex dihydrolipoamide dehydrogenase (E3) component